MRKIIKYITSIILFLLLFNCQLETKSPFEYIETNSVVLDSIVSFKDKYNQDFFVYYFEENDDYIMQTLADVDKPFRLNFNYDYKNINGVHILHIDFSKKIKIDEDHSSIDFLIDSGFVELNERDYFYDYWYMKFVYCKNKPQKIISYDKTQYRKKSNNALSMGTKNQNEKTFFYPNCD